MLKIGAIVIKNKKYSKYLRSMKPILPEQQQKRCDIFVSEPSSSATSKT